MSWDDLRLAEALGVLTETDPAYWLNCRIEVRTGALVRRAHVVSGEAVTHHPYRLAIPEAWEALQARELLPFDHPDSPRAFEQSASRTPKTIPAFLGFVWRRPETILRQEELLRETARRLMGWYGDPSRAATRILWESSTDASASRFPTFNGELPTFLQGRNVELLDTARVLALQDEMGAARRFLEAPWWRARAKVFDEERPWATERNPYTPKVTYFETAEVGVTWFHPDIRAVYRPLNYEFMLSPSPPLGAPAQPAPSRWRGTT
jgi:hypothetical protein